MKSILQVCAFAASKPGNFIASLLLLEKKMKKIGYETVYAFPERAQEQQWCKDMQQNSRVYFLPEAKARILPQTYMQFHEIYKENEIKITHCHFELYDIPATITAPKTIKVFWHLHDPIIVGHNLRGILWRIQYGVVGKRATLLSVSDYYRNIVTNLGFPKSKAKNILNGIDLSRIQIERECPQKYDFLTFGWDFYRKGDDLILQACDKLLLNGYKFSLLLNGTDATWKMLDEYLNGESRSYLIKGKPVENVSQLFAESKVFIQASRRETFSYAVCEAAYAGLQIISSDIPGLEWARDLPSIDFFEYEDVNGLYECMKKTLDNRSIDASLVQETRQKIEQEYSLEVWANNVIHSYFE